MKEKPEVTQIDTTESSAPKKEWQEPKLAFVKPKLSKHGSVKETTGGFFGTFVPPEPFRQ